MKDAILKWWVVIVIIGLFITWIRQGIVEAEMEQLDNEMSIYIETNYVYQPFLKAITSGTDWMYCGTYQTKTICSDTSYTYKEKELLLNR